MKIDFRIHARTNPTTKAREIGRVSVGIAPTGAMVGNLVPESGRWRFDPVGPRLAPYAGLVFASLDSAMLALTDAAAER